MPESSVLDSFFLHCAAMYSNGTLCLFHRRHCTPFCTINSLHYTCLHYQVVGSELSATVGGILYATPRLCQESCRFQMALS